MAIPEQEFAGNQMKPRTDWLAWFLQLIFGMFAGVGFGYVIARPLFSFGLIGFDQMLCVIPGVALCCGAFTSYYGDRAWMKRSVFAPPEAPQTQKPRTCSILIGAIGAALIVLPVMLHTNHYGWPAHRTSSMDANTFVLQNGQLQRVSASPNPFPVDLTIFNLILAAIPGFLLVQALRSGTGFWCFKAIDREYTPLYFWFYVILNGLTVFLILVTL